MLFSSTALITLLASCTAVSATFTRHQSYSWGCDKDQKDHAPPPVKNDCSSKGSFFTSYQGKAVCCSDKTRNNPPKPDKCPHNWSWNNRSGCCIPPKEICEKDCGEGYVFNKVNMCCDKKEVNKCGRGKWWHDRNKECCDDDYEPDKGKCPKDRSCPKDWHWSKKDKRCKPDKPRSPEPDCDDWNDHHGCCGGPTPPKPSPNPPHPPPPPPGPGYPTYPTTPGPPPPPPPPGPGYPTTPGPGGPKPPPPPPPPGHGKNKRNIDLRRASQIAFPQSDIDKMYCPGSLHACSVNAGFGGEWAYECIDFETELESCGGCSSTGDGQDCTKIDNAVAVGCELGVCAVYTCQSGFQANGTSCATA